MTATVKGGAGGSISPASATVNHGSSQTYTLTPSAGYHIVDLTVDGSSVGAVSTYTLDNITENHVLEASFSSTCTLATSVTGGEGGTVSPVSPSVPHGGSQTLTIAPAAGYCILAVSVDGMPVGAVSNYTFSNVSADHTLEVTFIPCYTISASVAGGTGGSISPTSATVNHGGSHAFTVTPSTGYHISEVIVDGTPVGAVSTYTFTNVTADHTIQASFAIDTFAITTSVAGGTGGSITPVSPTVNYGASQTFSITPASDYGISDVSVDGVSQGAIAIYTFSNVTANHTLTATFIALNLPVKNAQTGVGYTSLQAAYNAASDGDTLLCRDVSLTEDFTANRDISVTIDGGYTDGFAANPNLATLIGAPAVNSGTVTLQNFVIGN